MLTCVDLHGVNRKVIKTIHDHLQVEYELNLNKSHVHDKSNDSNLLAARYFQRGKLKTNACEAAVHG